MGNTYVVSDTHFVNSYHKDNRYREYINRWNTAVRPTDTVIHLGDVCSPTTSEKVLAILDELNGEKLLILGNHDGMWQNVECRNLKRYFTKIYTHYKIDDVLLTHAPVCPTWKEWHSVGGQLLDIPNLLKTIGNIRLNIHGHFHHHGTTKFEKRNAYHHRSTPYKMFCVHHTPTLLEEIISIL